MKTGIRFNVIVAPITVSNNGQSIKFEEHITYATDVCQAQLVHMVYKAKQAFPQERIFIEPNRLYTIEDYLEND